MVTVKDLAYIWRSVRALWDFAGGSVVFPTFVDTFLVLGADLVRCNGCILSDLSILTTVDPRIKSTTQVSFLDTLLRLSLEHTCYGR